MICKCPNCGTRFTAGPEMPDPYKPVTLGLTKKQAEALAYLKRRCRPGGLSPSYEEIAAGLGLKSKSGINRLIKGLEDRGAIRRLPNKPRSIEVLI